mgnify:CR=1 FL=1|tara:strand:- start:221 stop:637 length:417 start_codon:yes stop_codon:yes gene_type:complete
MPLKIDYTTSYHHTDKHAGGGIGGLCMLIGLLHQNISCTLYEAAPAFAEIGAGVSFGANAVRSMSLIDPEIKKGYDKIATSNASPAWKKCWFNFTLGAKEDGWKDLKTPGKEGVQVAQVCEWFGLVQIEVSYSFAQAM